MQDRGGGRDRNFVGKPMVNNRSPPGGAFMLDMPQGVPPGMPMPEATSMPMGQHPSMGTMQTGMLGPMALMSGPGMQLPGMTGPGPMTRVGQVQDHWRGSEGFDLERQDRGGRRGRSKEREEGRIRGRYGAAIPGPLPGAGRGSSTRVHANDYCQHFVDSGQRPQNFLRDSFLTDRYEEYPKMKELTRLKDEQVANAATPPYYIKADLRSLKLSVDTFGTKFDVIVVDPPWEEYQRRAPGLVHDPEVWSWQEIMALEIENVADNPCFIFLWCGCAEGLEAGRHCLNKWGFRRCEDICWIKTNVGHPKRRYLSAVHQEPNSVLVHTKEHCLMGIKGTVRRGPDSHVIHANCDTDIIVSEEPALGSTEKPEELYQIIERFSQGRRRLELFGEDHNIRQGWVTVGRSLTTSNFNPSVYASHFKNPDGSPFVENRSPQGRVPVGLPTLLPFVAEIEELRPKSPTQSIGRR